MGQSVIFRGFALALLIMIAGCGERGSSDQREALADVSNGDAPMRNQPATENGIAANQIASVPPLTEADIAALPEIRGDIVYACDPALTVSTRFVAQQTSSEETAGSDDMIVMVNGKAHRMQLVRSGSGAKYQAADGLIWWNKGPEGTLYQARDGEEQVVAKCTEKA